MSWRKSIIFAVDCLAVLAAVAMAAPFVLILVSPFIGGLGGYAGQAPAPNSRAKPNPSPPRRGVF